MLRNWTWDIFTSQNQTDLTLQLRWRAAMAVSIRPIDLAPRMSPRKGHTFAVIVDVGGTRGKSDACVAEVETYGGWTEQ